MRTNYNVTIPETQTLGVSIVTISARDPDELFVSVFVFTDLIVIFVHVLLFNFFLSENKGIFLY